MKMEFVKEIVKLITLTNAYTEYEIQVYVKKVSILILVIVKIVSFTQNIMLILSCQMSPRSKDGILLEKV